MDKAKLTCLADVKPNVKDGNYRRGYVHGYISAVKERQSRGIDEEMLDFVRGELMDWRYGDTSELTPPPGFK